MPLNFRGGNCSMKLFTLRTMNVIVIREESSALQRKEQENGPHVWTACSIASRTVLNDALGLLYWGALMASLPQRGINGAVESTRLSYDTGGRKERLE